MPAATLPQPGRVRARRSGQFAPPCGASPVSEPRFLLTHACRSGCDSPRMTVFMTGQKLATLRCGCLHPLSCSACVKGTYLTTSYKMLTPSCQKKQSHSSCCTSLHAFSPRQWPPKEPMSSHRPESQRSFPCARGLLEAVARSSPCTARKVVTASFLFNCAESNSSSERRARSITSFVARPSASIIRPHSNDRSVTVYLTSIPVCARYLSIVSVVPLTQPADHCRFSITFSCLPASCFTNTARAPLSDRDECQAAFNELRTLVSAQFGQVCDTSKLARVFNLWEDSSNACFLERWRLLSAPRQTFQRK